MTGVQTCALPISGLAIIPAGSIAVVGWLTATAILIALALFDKWLDRRAEATAEPAPAGS